MSAISFQTQEFPTEAEGDLILCNGQPGSALANWLRAALSDQGVATGEAIQEDYGWGFWLDDPTTVWVAVSYAGGDRDDTENIPAWGVSVAHEIPIFAPRQWFRRKAGRELASRVFEIVHHILSQRSGIMIEWIEHD